jgi:hypothetical protein
LEKHSVEAVFDIVLGEPWRTKLGVGVAQEREESVQGASKLHSFRRGMRYCRFVYRVPVSRPGVVAKESRFAVAFVFDCSWGEHYLF